jgi:hypothetical protein
VDGAGIASASASVWSGPIMRWALVGGAVSRGGKAASWAQAYFPCSGVGNLWVCRGAIAGGSFVRVGMAVVDGWRGGELGLKRVARSVGTRQYCAMHRPVIHPPLRSPHFRLAEMKKRDSLQAGSFSSGGGGRRGGRRSGKSGPGVRQTAGMGKGKGSDEAAFCCFCSEIPVSPIRCVLA